MKRGHKFIASAMAAAVALVVSSSAFALPVINVLGDTGVIQVQTYAPPSLSSAPLTNPYGTPPAPTITPLAGGNGWTIHVPITSQFLATANNFSGGKTTTMDGQLKLLISFDTGVRLTTNIYEDGIFTKVGGGTVDVIGGVVVSEADHAIPNESVSSFFPNEAYLNNGLWKLFDQATGFNGTYSSYTITLDNTLIAEALGAQAFSSGYIAKKDLTIVLTTDGSNGGGQPNVPEPTSLGLLGLGAFALMSRRRA